MRTLSFMFVFPTVVGFLLSPLCAERAPHLLPTTTDILTGDHHVWDQLLLHFSLHSGCSECDRSNTKPCHFCPVPSVYLSVPPDQQQGQCGHQPQRACSHSFSGTLSACLAALHVFLSLSVHIFSLIWPNYAATPTSMPLSISQWRLFLFHEASESHMSSVAVWHELSTWLLYCNATWVHMSCIFLCCWWWLEWHHWCHCMSTVVHF